MYTASSTFVVRDAPESYLPMLLFDLYNLFSLFLHGWILTFPSGNYVHRIAKATLFENIVAQLPGLDLHKTSPPNGVLPR